MLDCTTLDMMYKSLGSASFRSLALAHVGSHRSMGLSMFGGILVRPGLGGFVVGFLSWVGVGESNTLYQWRLPCRTQQRIRRLRCSSGFLAALTFLLVL